MSPRKDPNIIGRVSWAWGTAEEKDWRWVLRRGDLGKERLHEQEAFQGQAKGEDWGWASSSHPHSSGKRGDGQEGGRQVITTQGLPGGVFGSGAASLGGQDPCIPPPREIQKETKETLNTYYVTGMAAQIQTPTPPLLSWVTLGKRQQPSVPQFPQGS